MRITIVTGPFAPLRPAGCGAVETVWVGLAKSFAAEGHKVTFLCRGPLTQREDDVSGGVNYVPIWHFRRSRWLLWDLVRDFAYVLRLLPHLPHAEILVSNTFWLPVLAPQMRSKCGKVVVNVQRMPKRQLWLYRRAHRFTAVSRPVESAILRQVPSAAHRTRVIPNPIDTCVFRPPPVRNWNGLKTLLYVGRIHPEKGLELLVKSFAEVASNNEAVRLRCVGPWDVEGGGGGSEYQKHLLRQAPVTVTTFVGPIFDEAMLAAELQQSHIFCYPSLAENGESFGVAPLQAMATGLPVVVSDLPCFREFVENGQTGWIFDHRGVSGQGKLVSALKQALAAPELSKEVGSRAAHVAARFSYTRVASEYLAAFEELLSNG